MKILRKHKLGLPKKYVYVTAILFSFAVVLQVSSTEQNPTLLVYLRHSVLFTSIYIFWALCIDYLNGIVKPIQNNRSSLFQIFERILSATLLVLGNLILTNLLYYSVLIVFTDFTLSEVYQDFQPYILKSIIIRFFDIVVIGLVLKVVEAYQTVQEQNLKVVSLESKLHLAQLESLRNQLDPHFLFNALHTLNTLVGYDDKKARSMVIKITNLLRKILDKREKQVITFEEELDYFKDYLEIEKERFFDRLVVEINIEESAKQILVPTLMLQPLIENAFKHGISQLEEKGKINLEAKIDKNKLDIKLVNDVPVLEVLRPETSTKVGLENLQSRLQQVYDNEYSFKAEKSGTSFVVQLMIPKTPKL